MRSVYTCTLTDKSDSVSGGLRNSYKKVEYGDAACAICEAEAEDTLMIPGKKTCPRGYSELYKGHIAGSRYTSFQLRQYLCSDQYYNRVERCPVGMDDGFNEAPSLNTRVYLLKVQS